MKKLIIWLLFLPTLIMADAVIFSGSDVKALKQNLDLFGVVKVMSGTLDPSAGGGVAAPVGSAYLSKVHGLFLKTGVSNTAWTKNALLPVDLTAQVTGILPPSNGGTGSSAVPTNGQIPIGNGTNYQAASITGTANQVSVTNGAGSITLSTPQDIATTSNVQFANLNATGTTTLNSGLTGPLKASLGVVSSSAINLGTEVTGTLPIANGGTGSATQNFVDLTTNQTVAGEKTFSNTLKSDSIQTTGSSGVVIKNSSGTTVADFGPANTTNASIVGGLNVGGNIVATGTVTGSNLSGTNTGDDTLGTQEAGVIGTFKDLSFPNYQVVETNSTTKQFGIDTGNKNELYNGSFEAQVTTVGWITSNATSSGSTSAIEGKKALSLTLTGALSLSQSSTINAARKSGVQMVASVWVNSSDVSDLQLCSLKNGAEDKCTVTGGYVQGSGWRQLTVSFIGDATSNGLKLKSTDTTGTVLVDQAYVGVGSPVVDFTPDMVYSAKVSATGVVTGENTDWINGSCTTSSGTQNFTTTCNFASNIFTVAPNCLVSLNKGFDWTGGIQTVTNSSVSYTVSNVGSGSTGTDVYLICQKQGADYKTSKAYVASAGNQGLEAGTIIPTSAASCPAGTLPADGSPVSRTTYSELFAKIGVTHGQGDGSTTFNVPDYRGRFLRGVDGSAGNDPDKASRTAMATGGNTGNNVGSVQGDAFQGHWHFVYKGSSASANFGPSGGWSGNTTVAAIDLTGMIATSLTTDGVNGTPRASSETRPKNAYVNYCIRTTSQSTIVGSFQGYNETPGTSRVETFSVSYGTTNASTSCSASPCSYLDQIGNSVTSVTRSGAGQYAINTSKTYSKLKCSWVGSGSVGIVIGSNIQCSNCNSLAFDTVRRTDGVSDDSRGTLLCQGIPQ